MSTKSTVTAQVLPPPAPSGSAVGSRPRQPESLSESQFSSLLSAMQESERRLDRKLADFRSDVRQAQDEAATKAVSRVQREKPYEFKRKAHEEQARFNAQIEESVLEAQGALATVDVSPSLQRAQEALEKGARLLAERQKLIKIADRSANGWGVVAEYTADELADDSEDEKRLEKAEKAAERKAGLKKRKRVQPAARPSPRLPRYAPYGGYAYPLQQQQQHQQPGPSHNLGSRRPGPPTGPLAQRAVGPCFACGEMGHLRTYCPKMQSQERKWYPSQMLMHESVPVVGVPDVCEVMMQGRVECCSSASSCTVRDVLAGGSPTTPSVGVTSFPPPFETSIISMVMEDVVEIDPGNLSVSMAMGDVVEIDPENLSVGWEIESSGTDYMSGGVVV